MKTLPSWLGRLASVRSGLGAKNCGKETPIIIGAMYVRQNTQTKDCRHDIKAVEE